MALLRSLPAALLTAALAGPAWAQPAPAAGTPPGAAPAGEHAPPAAVVPQVQQPAPGEHAAPAEPAAASDPAVAPLGDTPHPAAAAHEGAVHGGQAVHGEAHGGPVIENWWSWDYGPGRTHRHPPFGFAILNFFIYLYILQRLAWGSFKAFMKNRHLGVRRALDEAAALRRKAEEELRRYEARIQGLEAEVAELLQSVRREAEAERARIIAAAQAQAAAMMRDAEAQVRAEIERARLDLRKKVALAAASAAEAILRSQIQDQDHKHLTEEYVARVEAMSGIAPRSPSRPAAR